MLSPDAESETTAVDAVTSINDIEEAEDQEVEEDSPVTIDVSEEQQQPVTQSLSACVCHQPHWRCLLLSLLMYSCLGTLAWCQLALVTKISFGVSLSSSSSSSSSSSTTTTLRGAGPAGGHSMVYHGSPCSDGHALVPLGLLLGLYAAYMVECWHCLARSRVQGRAAVGVGVAYECVRRMRRAPPRVWWTAVSYHLAPRYRQRYRDAHGATRERVVTHVAQGEFDYAGVADVSRDLLGLEGHPATRLRFTKCFSFVDAGPENAYLRQRARFFSEAEGLDDYMEAREGMQLKDVDFREHLTAYADPDRPPWYASRTVFWLAALLTLSWPLRVLREYRTAYVHYRVEKLFGVDRSPGSGCLSRVDTLDSVRLEWHIRSNRQLVPSYSEAALASRCAGAEARDGSSSDRRLLLDAGRPSRGYGALLAPGDCENCCCPPQDGRIRRTITSCSCSSSSFSCLAPFSSRLSLDTSLFSLCHVHGSLCHVHGSGGTAGMWGSRCSDLSDERHRRSDSSQLPLNHSPPPTYGDARFCPVLMLHRPEGCGSQEGREGRPYGTRRGSCCLESSL